VVVAAPQQVEAGGDALGPAREPVGELEALLGAQRGQPLDRGGDQGRARLEVVEVRAAGHACPLGHAGGRRVRVPVLDEALDRRVEQRVDRRSGALRLRAAFTGSRRRRGHQARDRSYLRSRMNVSC
jgi:hypothetical protein